MDHGGGAPNVDLRVYFHVEAAICRGANMTSGMIQWCSTSTVDLPQGLEHFIYYTHRIIRSAQLSARV